MTDEHALLAAMAADPTDDTVRLAYADFLEENGQTERADFVRVQVELSRTNANDAERRALVLRHLRFLRDFVPQWRAELPQLPGIEWGDFNRGLVEEVQAGTEDAVVKNAAAIFAEPAVHIIRLSGFTDGRAFAKLPQLARVKALRMIGAGAGDGVLQRLFASPHLGNLKVLDLHGNFLGDEGATDLSDGRFPALTELWLGSNWVENAGGWALAAASHFRALRVLDLRGNRIHDAAARAALVKRFGPAVKL